MSELQESITMASELLDEREEVVDSDSATLPGTVGSIDGTPYCGPPFEFVPSAGEALVDETDVEELMEVPETQGGIFDTPIHREPPRVQCPWCSSSSTASGGIVRHISARHEGRIIEENGRYVFHGFGKGCCLSCGALRARTGIIVVDVVQAPELVV